MVQIVLDGAGVSKASLIEGAFEYCGLNGFEFERTPEEMTTGLRHLNALLAEWEGNGILLGFDFPTYAQGLPEEPSGVPAHANAVIHMALAQRLIAGIGGTLSEDAKAAFSMSFQGLRSRTAVAPPSMVPAYMMRTNAMRHRNRRYVSNTTTTPIVVVPSIPTPTPSPSAGTFLLLEDGSFLLLEDGSFLMSD